MSHFPPVIEHAAPHIVVQWIKQLVAGFSQRSNVFDSRETWHWDKFQSKYFSLLLPVYCQHCTILTHLSITDAI